MHAINESEKAGMPRSNALPCNGAMCTITAALRHTGAGSSALAQMSIKFDHIVNAVLRCAGCMSKRASEEASKRRHRTCGGKRGSCHECSQSSAQCKGVAGGSEPVEHMKMRKLKNERDI
jgi:hypothetical protein